MCLVGCLWLSDVHLLFVWVNFFVFCRHCDNLAEIIGLQREKFFWGVVCLFVFVFLAYSSGGSSPQSIEPQQERIEQLLCSASTSQRWVKDFGPTVFQMQPSTDTGTPYGPSPRHFTVSQEHHAGDCVLSTGTFEWYIRLQTASLSSQTEIYLPEILNDSY